MRRATTWQQAALHPCPKCGASVAEVCTTGGRKRRREDMHAARFSVATRAAADAALLRATSDRVAAHGGA